MKHNVFKGFSKVFSFTAKKLICSASYKAVTSIIAVLAIVLISGIMALVETESKKDADNRNYQSPVENVIVYDHSDTGYADFNILNELYESGFKKIKYEAADSFENAVALSENRENSLIIDISNGADKELNASVIIPDGSEISRSDAKRFADYLNESFYVIMVVKSNLTPNQLEAALVDFTVSSGIESAKNLIVEPEPYDAAKQVLRIVLPYVNVMLLYFMVLFYGQSVSNSVVSEKSSKLMETFLISLKPGAMILAKVLAVALSGVIQLAIWILSGVAGFALGEYFVKLINPNTHMSLISLIDSLGSVTGMFTVPGIIVSVLILIAGFLLYCSLASIGGAIASKQEELASTNSIFSMVLVISFLATLYAGVMDEGSVAGMSNVIYYIPFTSILVVPGKLLVGDMPLAGAIVSLLITLLCTLIIIVFSGKLYSMTALYSGAPLTPKKAFMMLKSKKGKQ